MFNEGIILVHLISSHGIKVDTSKVEIISKFSILVFQRDVRSFHRFAGYYRRFIENYTKITSPLFKLLKNIVNLLGIIAIKKHLRH